MKPRSSATSPVNIQPIHRLLQINVCVLFCLAGIVFAVAEGNPLGFLSVPIAIAGLILTDRKNLFGLPAWVANGLGFAAFLAAGIEFFAGSIEGRLLGFGHLLLYLGWILMLQRKGKPQYWWISALSALQVATAAVLTNDVWFPLAAMLFMILALWSLSIFSLDRAVARSAGVERSARLARGGGSDSVQQSASESGPETDASRSRSEVRAESLSRWITPRFVCGVLLNAFLSLMLGLAIFILTPRIWAGGFQMFTDSTLSAGQPLTGFADEVSLGDMGEILENPDIVLEVGFFDEETEEKLSVGDAMRRMGHDIPLFRGKVMSAYDNGQWKAPKISSPTTRSFRGFREPVVRQEVTLHPIGTLTLFAAGRTISCRAEDRTRIKHDLLSDVFTIGGEIESRGGLNDIFRYSAYAVENTDAPWGTYLPGRASDVGTYMRSMLRVPLNLTRLQRLARELTRPEDGRILTELDIADTFVSYLRDSGEFSYSLKVDIQDPTIDPVEDFIFNRKSGHCEYYASALVLLLRSANIPARLISGFKGGDFNEETEQFEVRQLHAHAWAEAMIDGRWVVLDATPATREESIAEINASLSPVALMKRFAQEWWARGLQMNQTQQRRAIYEPLKELFEGGVSSVRRVGLFQAILQWFRQLSANPGEWISWGGFVTAFSLGLLISLIVWGFRKAFGALSKILRHRSRQHRRERQIVEFYERFRTLTARQGYARSETTTHQEFADAVESDWKNRPDVDGLATLPTRLTDAFYRVRFGGQPLDNDELQSLDASLGQLETWVRAKK